ncbi:MAG: YdbH domain-containing protein [Pseudomonadota bacterium]
MSKSLTRSLIKWTLRLVPWVLALCLGAGWWLSAWTPGYLERLIPGLARDMGLPVAEFHIRSAGLFSADIGPVTLAAPSGDAADGLRLESVRVTYTPASLRLGRVHRVIIRGAALTGSHDGQTFHLPLLDLLPAAEKNAQAGKSPLPDLPLDALVIENSTLTLDLPDTRLSIPFAATVALPDEVGDTLRVAATLRLRDQPVAVTADLGPTLDDLTLTIATQGFRLASLGDLLPLAVGGDLDLDLTAALDLSKPQDMKATASAALHRPDLACLGVTLADGAPLGLAAQLADGNATAQLAPVALTGPHPLTLHVPEISLSADSVRAAFTLASTETLPAGTVIPGTFTAERDDTGWAVALSMEEKGALRLVAGDRIARLAGLALSLRGSVSPATPDAPPGTPPGTPLTASMVLEARTRASSLDGTDFATGPVALRLPLAWPAPNRHDSGRLTVTGIRAGGRAIGSLAATLRQESLGIRFSGHLDTSLLPKLRVPFAGAASLDGPSATLDFSVDRYDLPAGFDPGTLVPALAGVSASGTLAIEGGATFDDSGLRTRLGLFVSDGAMIVGGDKEGGVKESGGEKSGVRLEGIRLFFESPDVIDFRSAPAQVLTIERVRAAGIEMTEAVIAFQLEPGGVTLVEGVRFDWCGGHVESRAFRVVPGHEEYDVTLHCTGLRLSDLLEQLGLAKARGDSTLSGELPVSWRNGQITFHQGFLHSTPGEGGFIQVEGLDDLVAAVPKGTAERSQLELARAALGNFEYKWIRLRADTVGRDLLMRLSLDGKPANILPFVYRKDIGGFVKIEGDIDGSHFQGVRLDVNFTLPLDRILLYKDVIGRIQ